MLIIVVAAAALLWLLLGSKHAGASTGVISAGPDDFDSATASQLGGAAAGDVSIGDEWSATFTKGNGDWSDAYKSHSFSTDDLMVDKK